jgi:hypothetical protein
MTALGQHESTLYELAVVVDLVLLFESRGLEITKISVLT